MTRLPPRSTRTDTLFPYTTLFRSREDLPELIAHFLGQMDAETRFSPAAMRMLAAYDWPGNVRELRNVIERATILHPDAEVSAEDIELLIGAAISVPPDMAESVAVWEARKSVG